MLHEYNTFKFVSGGCCNYPKMFLQIVRKNLVSIQDSFGQEGQGWTGWGHHCTASASWFGVPWLHQGCGRTRFKHRFYMGFNMGLTLLFKRPTSTIYLYPSNEQGVKTHDLKRILDNFNTLFSYVSSNVSMRALSAWNFCTHSFLQQVACFSDELCLRRLTSGTLSVILKQKEIMMALILSWGFRFRLYSYIDKLYTDNTDMRKTC